MSFSNQSMHSECKPQEIIWYYQCNCYSTSYHGNYSWYSFFVLSKCQSIKEGSLQLRWSHCSLIITCSYIHKAHRNSICTFSSESNKSGKYVDRELSNIAEQKLSQICQKFHLFPFSLRLNKEMLLIIAMSKRLHCCHCSQCGKNWWQRARFENGWNQRPTIWLWRLWRLAIRLILFYSKLQRFFCFRFRIFK